MPRAPHKSALFAPKPLANCIVFCRRVSRERLIPTKSSNATRDTSLTGTSRSGATCQTKASALSKSGEDKGAGAMRSSAAAIRLNSSAIFALAKFFVSVLIIKERVVLNGLFILVVIIPFGAQLFFAFLFNPRNKEYGHLVKPINNNK